ncbi:MAG: 30S ribosomal protein S9, partial [Anaerolineales bacterium]
MAEQYYEGVGRRKRSTARVRVMLGEGRFFINEKPFKEYFTRMGDVQTIIAPLEATSQNLQNLDISVYVRGGGVT